MFSKIRDAYEQFIQALMTYFSFNGTSNPITDMNVFPPFEWASELLNIYQNNLTLNSRGIGLYLFNYGT